MEKIKTYISVLEGVVSFYERMTLSDCKSVNVITDETNQCCLKWFCGMYAEAIRTAVKVMKGETVELRPVDREQHERFIRCLIGYHKNEKYKCWDCERERIEIGAVDRCKDPEDGHTKCPKADGDIYLEALEEGLRHIVDKTTVTDDFE